MGPDGSERPLMIARYAEHCLDGLSAPATSGPLLDSPSFCPPAHLSNPNDALEAALRTWARAAHTELQREPPSAAVLRNIASQAAHVYAAAEHLIAAAAEVGVTPARTAVDVRAPRQTAARDFVTLAGHWKPITTLQRPRLEYVSATETLSATLAGIARDGMTMRTSRDLAAHLDLERALVDLRAVAFSAVPVIPVQSYEPDPAGFGGPTL